MLIDAILLFMYTVVAIREYLFFSETFARYTRFQNRSHFFDGLSHGTTSFATHLRYKLKCVGKQFCTLLHSLMHLLIGLVFSFYSF